MIRDVLALLDFNLWAELSMVMFATVFVAVALRTWFADRETYTRRAELVLAGGEEEGKFDE